MNTAGMTSGPIAFIKQKKSSFNLLNVIVASGSPIGVKAAPSPIEKQAKTVKRTSSRTKAKAKS